MEKSKFATAINCIDGRVQGPVSAWMKEYFHVHYVDMITEPGLNRVLTQGPAEVVESIRQEVMISLRAHQSSTIAVVGHHDCAGNPVSPEERVEQIKKGVEVVTSWRLPVRVVGLWVNERWGIKVVCDTEQRAFA